MPPGSDEARHIVDMTIGVVVSETLIEPNDLARAEGLVKRSFGLLLAPIVAVGVKQSLAGGEDHAGPVLVDSATFEHEIEFSGLVAGKLGDAVADGLIVGEVELAAPSIELEAECEFVPVAPREDRASIAQPYVAVQAHERTRRRPQAPRARWFQSRRRSPAAAPGSSAQARAPARRHRGAARRGPRSIPQGRRAMRSRSPFAGPTPAEPKSMCPSRRLS